MKREYMKLDVWKKAHLLALDIFKTTRPIARTRRDDLAANICGVAFGISSSIALGCEKGDDVTFHKALEEALENAKALEIELSVLHDLGLMDDRDYLSRPKLDRFQKRTAEVEAMVSEEITKLRVPISKSTPQK
jgi:four helix bundle protein